MSTNAVLMRKLPNGKIESTYVHWDGYIEGVGKTLLTHYQNPEKVNDLFAMGQISCLRGSIEETESYYKKGGYVPTYYKNFISKDTENACSYFGSAKYGYFYIGGEWLAFDPKKDHCFAIPLACILDKEETNVD